MTLPSKAISRFLHKRQKDHPIHPIKHQTILNHRTTLIQTDTDRRPGNDDKAKSRYNLFPSLISMSIY